jgi:hypothetical protein
VFSNFNAEEYRPSAWLAVAWKELLDRWEDPSTHERFVRDAQLRDELTGAGRLYRLRLAHAPEDAMARHGRETLLNAVSSAATTVLGGTSATAQGVRWARRVAIALGVLLVLAVLWGLFAVLRRTLASTP